MLGTRLDLVEHRGENHGEFTALVGLAGSLCGVLTLRCSSLAASAMAGRMLNMPPEEVGEQSRDAFGEIANMIAGNFKGKLGGIGNHCLLSVPIIVVGSNYESRSHMASNVIELVCEFEKKPLRITLELHS